MTPDGFDELLHLEALLDEGSISRREFMQRVALIGGTAALLTSGLTAAPALARTPAKQGGTLTVAIGIDMDTLDPVGQTTTTVSNVVDMMCEPLLTIDQKGHLKALLAENWHVSKDAKTYIFNLRKGIKFHDGTPFNAHAAKVNFERLLDPNIKVPARGVLTLIHAVTVHGPYQIQLHLKAPSAVAPILGTLTSTTAAMVSPASLSKDGNSRDHVVHPVGTGPYRFGEYVHGDHVTLHRNDKYWGRKPAYATQVMKIVPEAASREALIRAGQADVIILPPASDLPALKSGSTRVLLAPSDRSVFIHINNRSTLQPLLKKKEVRQALNYAVDKQAIIKSVLFGSAIELQAPMPPMLFGYHKFGAYPYNPAKAKAMLKAAGAEHMTVKLMSPTGRYTQDIQAANAIAGYLRQVGLKVNGPTTSDWPSYVAAVNQAPPNTDELHLLGWAPSYLDAQQQMEIYQGNQIPPAGLNTCYFDNPTVNKMLGEAASQTNAGKRKKEFYQAAKIVWEDCPSIFLWYQKFPIVYSTRVKGVSYLPNEKFLTVYAEPA